MNLPVATAGLLLLVAASACAGPIAPPPKEGLPDRAGAPVIVAPRDLAPKASAPCAMLSDPQVEELGLEAPGESRVTMAGSPSCTWGAGPSGARVGVSVALRGDLFVATYRSRRSPIFRPLEIGALPAVDTMTRVDAPTCTTTVGVADSESLDVTALAAVGDGGRPAEDPCELGHRVAEAIIANLPPKPR